MERESGREKDWFRLSWIPLGGTACVLVVEREIGSKLSWIPLGRRAAIMYGCKYIRGGRWCKHGCTHSFTVCHSFARGMCERPSDPSCRRGYHFISDPPPQVDPTTAALRELGLNENGVNVSRGSVEAVFRVRALQTHPDKHPSNVREQKSAEFRKVSEAKDHLLTIYF